MAAAALDVQAVREQFPALKQPQVFLDNAGGSQILGAAADSIRDYLCTNNVQLGATYKAGEQSTQAYRAGLECAARYINAAPDEIVIGPSTTQLLHNLSIALLPHLAKRPSAEFVLSTLDHEANVSAWVFLARALNLTIKWWTPAPGTTNPHLTPASLLPLLTPDTFLVACTHASNVLGTITDVRALARAVHSAVPGALICVDGVALAPHRPVDVQALEVDFYAFSWYKVYGPHVAQLYARRAAQDAAMTSLGHYFKDARPLEEKLGLGGASYELVQAVPAVVAYLERVGWAPMVAHEADLQRVLLDYLARRPDRYQVYGEPSADAALRVPVVSFVVKGRSSREVVARVERSTDFGFRWGHFYSKRLVEEVLDVGEQGVVRVSMVHYNTIQEIEALVEALDKEVC